MEGPARSPREESLFARSKVVEHTKSASSALPGCLCAVEFGTSIVAYHGHGMVSGGMAQDGIG